MGIGAGVAVGFAVGAGAIATGASGVSDGPSNLVAAANPGNTPPQCSSTSARMSATVWRPSAIALSAACNRNSLSRPEYCPSHTAKAFTTNSLSVGGCGVGVAVALGTGVDVGVGAGVSVGTGVLVGVGATTTAGKGVAVGAVVGVGDGVGTAAAAWEPP